jgi:uncharacterized membrane protein YbhN (UPF0104 family)
VNKVLRLVISAALLAWLGSRTDWAQVGRAFAGLRPEWWLGAVAVYVASQVVSALRWQMLARPLGFGQPLRQFTGYCFIGMYFNLFLPTSVGGDVVRAWYLSGGSGRRLAAFLSVFVDRCSGLGVLLGMACLAMALCPVEVPAWVPVSVWGAGSCAVAGLCLAPTAARWTHRFARVRRLTEGARQYLRRPRVLVGSTALSLVIQVVNVLIVWMLAQGMGIEAPLAYFWIAVPMVTLLTMVPVSLNGMGVREWGMVLFLHPLGVSAGTAMSLAFLWFAVFTAVSLLGGGVYLFGRFPRPQVQSDHEPVRGDPDQGRAGEFKAAA